MPILEISALKPVDTIDVPKALKHVNGAIAKQCNCDLHHVWSTVTWLASGHYAEGECTADNQPTKTHKPIARLTCFEGLAQAQIEDLLLVTSQAMSEAFGLGDNVFVMYCEAKSGQVAAANKIERS